MSGQPPEDSISPSLSQKYMILWYTPIVTIMQRNRKNKREFQRKVRKPRTSWGRLPATHFADRVVPTTKFPRSHLSIRALRQVARWDTIAYTAAEQV